ncbi:MAG: hypothetical protein M3505_08935 [Verrucomicrobiota bacterium]|nr:hypothetical protein [Verrucomicrobiota bacterium]
MRVLEEIRRLFVDEPVRVLLVRSVGTRDDFNAECDDGEEAQVMRARHHYFGRDTSAQTYPLGSATNASTPKS